MPKRKWLRPKRLNMPNNGSFDITFINPVNKVRDFILEAWSNTIISVSNWIISDLLRALVYGGLGIKGIAETPFYQWVISSEGLSELGIDQNEPPKLLNAYLTTAFKLNTTKYSVNLQFGDIAELELSTPHPAAGTGQLNIKSWMEFVFDGASAPDHGFIPRSSIPASFQKNIRLTSPLGGLMLPMGILGSTGHWSLPEQFITYDLKWLKENENDISAAIYAKAAELFQKELT